MSSERLPYDPRLHLKSQVTDAESRLATLPLQVAIRCAAVQRRTAFSRLMSGLTLTYTDNGRSGVRHADISYMSPRDFCKIHHWLRLNASLERRSDLAHFIAVYSPFPQDAGHLGLKRPFIIGQRGGTTIPLGFSHQCYCNMLPASSIHFAFI